MKNYDQLDYTAFSDKISSDDIDLFVAQNKLTSSASYPTHFSRTFWTILGIVGLLPGIGIMAFMSLYADTKGLILGIVFGTLFSIFILPVLFLPAIIVYSMGRKQWTKIIQFSRFATANGMEYRNDSDATLYNGAIFTIGYGKKISHLLRTKDGIETGEYVYTIGFGKDIQTYKWQYLTMPLDAMSPHLLLDATSNNKNIIGIKKTNLPSLTGLKYKVSLEGDFDTHFSLYSDKKNAQSAFYIFTPDVMAALIDYGSLYDIEVTGDRLFIYYQVPTRGNIDSAVVLKMLFQASAQFGDKIRKRSNRLTVHQSAEETAANIPTKEGNVFTRNKWAFSTLFSTIIVIVCGLLLMSVLENN